MVRRHDDMGGNSDSETVIEPRTELVHHWDTHASNDPPFDGMTYDDCGFLEHHFPALGHALHDMCLKAQQEAQNGEND